MMNRQNFGRLSGTIVDTCAGHGTFLDRGELHQVVKFILEGGFSRMRQAELERIKEEQQRLRELEMHLRGSRGREI
jgi:Zn-finger nucleic acid-binding protein